MASRSIEIPEETWQALHEQLERLGFGSVDELASYALGLLVSGRTSDGKGLTEDEEAEMRQRLADLGYL